MTDRINEDRIQRIIRMEQTLDASSAAVSALTDALELYQEVLPALQELIEYYSSPLWREDYDADEDGLLPAGLKRGVLSEDAVYNLLCDRHQLITELKTILETDPEVKT